MSDAVVWDAPTPRDGAYPEYMNDLPVVFAQENKALSPPADFGYLAAVDSQGFGGSWDRINTWHGLYPDRTFAVWHISFEYQAGVDPLEPGHTGKGLLFDGVTETTGEEIPNVTGAHWYGARGVFAGHWLYKPGSYTTASLSSSGTSVQVADGSKIHAGCYVVIRKGRHRATMPGGGWRDYDASGEWAEAEFAMVTSKNGNTINLSQRGYSGSRGPLATATNAHPTDSYIANVVEGQAGPKTWRWNCARGYCPYDASGQIFNDYLVEYYWNIYMAVGSSGAPIDAEVAGFFWDIDSSDLSSTYYGPPDADNDTVGEGGWDPETGENRYGQGMKDFNESLVQYFEDHPHPRAPYLPFVYMGARESETERGASGYQAEQAFVGFHIDNPDPAASNLYRGQLDLDLGRLKWQAKRVGHGPAGSQVLLKNATEAYPYVKGNPINVPQGLGEKTARFSLALATTLGAAFSHMNWYSGGSDPDVNRFHDEYAVDIASASTAVSNEDRHAHRFWLGEPLGPYYRVGGGDAKYALSQNLMANPFFETDLDGYQAIGGTMSRVTDEVWPFNPHGASLLWQGMASWSVQMTGAQLVMPPVSFKQGTWYSLSIAARADLTAPSCDGALKQAQVAHNGAQWSGTHIFTGPEWNVAIINFLWGGAQTTSLKLNLGRYDCPTWIGGVLLFEGHSGILRRDYDNGVVVVNATEEAVTIPLGGPFHHIQGIVDAPFNDGQKDVTEVTLGKYDARFLVRPQ